MSVRSQIEDSAPYFTVQALSREQDNNIINAALDVVRQFIIERGLILYGGQAIDYALRLKNKSLYPPDQRPDYDCYSSSNVEDAYDLADLLVSKGFICVGAMPAIHVQTMRVSTNFVFVADITYAPCKTFELLPFLSYKGMRFVHPHYQRLDMHMAFCFPLNSPPREDIFNRFRKDLKRFNMLQQMYPITGHGYKLKNICRRWVYFDPKTMVLHGLLAYAALRHATVERFKALKGAPLNYLKRKFKKLPKVSLMFKQVDGAIYISSSVDMYCFASPYPSGVIELLQKKHGPASVQWFAPYMDSCPIVGHFAGPEGGVDVYSTTNRRLAMVWQTINNISFFMVSPQYLLVYLLHKDLNTDASWPILYYESVLTLLELGGEMLIKEQTDVHKLEKLVQQTPFGLSCTSFDSPNISSAYMIREANAAKHVHDLTIQQKRLLAETPSRYYPTIKKHKPRPLFDYKNNKHFLRGGELIENYSTI